MPSNFPNINNGDIIDQNDVDRYTVPVNNLESGAAWYRDATGTANAVKVNFATGNTISSYTPGQIVHFKAAATNTGAATLTITGPSGDLAAIPLVKKGGVALAAGDISADQVVAAIYAEDSPGVDGRFEVLGGLSSGVGGGLTSPVAIADGGTGATTAAGARTNLDVPSVSDLTTGLSGKASTSHTHAAGDITTGTLGLAQGGTNANLSATGGAGHVLKQTSAGGAITVGALTASDMPSGIDASKIGGGAVSNTELSYLDGVTSPVQAQLDGKAGVSHTHAASDITSGTLPVARGGTGAGSAADARTNLGAQAANDYLNQLVALLPTMAPGQLITVDGSGDLVAAEPSTSTGENMNNIGDFKHSFALTAPDGWLECDGSILSQSAYPDLYAAIGSNWGPPYASGTESAALSSLNAAPRIKKLGALWFAYHNGASAYYYSSNGTTWTSASVPGGTYVRDIAYSSSLGLYILASGNGSGALYSSTTGTGSWTSRSTAADFQAVEWNGTRFIALHNAGAYTSTNGTSWSSSATVSFIPYQLYYSAMLSLWILGAGSYIYSGSSDGTTWTQRHTTYAGGVYWVAEAAGYIWVSTNNGLYRSANGTSWSIFTLALPSGYSATGGLYPTAFGLACVATNGTLVKLFMSEDGGTTWPAEASATWDPPVSGAMMTGGALDAAGNICTGFGWSNNNYSNLWTPAFNASTQFPLPDIAPDSEGRLCYIKAEE